MLCRASQKHPYHSDQEQRGRAWDASLGRVHQGRVLLGPATSQSMGMAISSEDTGMVTKSKKGSAPGQTPIELQGKRQGKTKAQARVFTTPTVENLDSYKDTLRCSKGFGISKQFLRKRSESTCPECRSTKLKSLERPLR